MSCEGLIFLHDSVCISRKGMLHSIWYRAVSALSTNSVPCPAFPHPTPQRRILPQSRNIVSSNLSGKT